MIVSEAADEVEDAFLEMPIASDTSEVSNAFQLKQIFSWFLVKHCILGYGITMTTIQQYITR